MIEQLQTSAGEFLALALEKGADEAQVLASHSESTQVRFEKNDFTCTSANTQMNFGLKVHRDRKKGTASTNELGHEALAQSADRALTLAGFSLADEYLTLPEAQSPEELPGRFDPALAELPAAELHELAAAFVGVAQREPRLSLDGAELSLEVEHGAIANSRGLALADRTTRLGWTLMGLGKTEQETTSFDYLGGGAWAWERVAARAEQTAQNLVDRILSIFGARQGESYKGHVLLAPAVISDLILQPLAFHISGQQIMDGKSRWEESIGEAVASPGFSLVDNPFNLELGGSTPFDAEGVATRRTPIIEDGVLKQHIDSCYSASRRGTRTTGHAGGLHAIEIGAGDRTREELLAAADRLVVVERFSGNVDPVSGDFSGVAKNSHYYKGGEHQHPLTETMIAGNFFELLKNITALSNESRPFCNQYAAPWILVDGISVTAG